MIVKELKDKLNSFDPDKKIFIILPDDNPIDSGMDINDIFEMSGSKDETLNAVYLQTN